MKKKQKPKKPAKAKVKAPKPMKWHWWYSLQLVSFGGDNERDYILEYLALLIRSGMEVTGALKAIQQEMRNPALKYRVWQMQQELESGLSLSDAFEQSKLFNPQVVSLMRVGEESGRLPENLLAIVEQQQKNRAFKSQVRSASMYPAFVISITGMVGIGVAWFVLPQLAQVFSSLDMDLPLVTRVVIRLGQFLADYGNMVVPGVLLGFAVLVYLVFFFPKTKIIGQWILFGTPGIRRLIQEVELARFGYVLGSLLSAGLPILEALSALERATGMYRYRNLYRRTTEAIEAGETFEDVFDQVKRSRALVPAPIQQMIVTGEQSASMPQTLLRIGKTFEAKSETTTKNLSVILEPALLIVVWLGVAAVALAVVLPVYSLVGNITDQPGVGGSVRSAPVEAVSEQIADPEVPVVEEEASETVPVSAAETGTITSENGLNLREEASTDAAIVQVLAPETVVTILEDQDDWLRVQVGRVSGWVASAYVAR